MGRDTQKNQSKSKNRILAPFGYLLQLYFVVLLGRMLVHLKKVKREMRVDKRS